MIKNKKNKRKKFLQILEKFYNIALRKKIISDKDYPDLIMEDLNDGYSGFNYTDFYDFIAQKPEFHIYVEVGCWKGFSTAYLARKIQKKSGAKIYAIDLWDITEGMYFRWHPAYAPLKARKKTLFARFGTNIDSRRLIYDIYNANLVRNGIRDFVTDIREDSVKSANRFEDGQVDFVFIDAGHEYEEVKKDISAWLPKVRMGGIISGHDYDWRGVRSAVNEIFGSPNLFNRKVWYVVK